MDIYFWRGALCKELNQLPWSMKAPKLTTDFDKQQENILEVITGSAGINKTSLFQIESMVALTYHTRGLEA